MNHITKLTALLTGAGLLAVTACNAQETKSEPKPAAEKPAQAAPLFEDKVIVKGEGFEVKRSQLDTIVSGYKATSAARGQVLPPEVMGRVEKQLLERLIQIQLLVNRATPEDKAKGEELGGNRFNTFNERAGSEEAVERQLKSIGLTPEQLRQRLVEEATGETVLERELKPKATVTDEDVKKFYDENPARFEEPEMVRASHILLGTRDRATGEDLPDSEKSKKREEIEGLLKRARAGDDFAAMAKEHSEDPGSKDKGGEYVFPRGQMVPEFESAAFSLEPGQVSDVVTTTYGFHIIKLSEKIPAQKPEFSEVAGAIKDGLTMRQVQELLPEYFEQVKKEAKLEYLDETLKPE